MEANRYEQALPPFDELMELAEQNPGAFDQFKKEMCEEMILSASDKMQDRLRAQQSHIDRVVGQCKNPNQANVVLMQELSVQFGKFQNALGGDMECESEAVVIPFQPKQQENWR